MLTYLGLALIVAAAYATTRLTAPRHRAAAFAAIVGGVVLGAAGLLARFDDPHNPAHWIIGGTVTVLAAVMHPPRPEPEDTMTDHRPIGKRTRRPPRPHLPRRPRPHPRTRLTRTPAIANGAASTAAEAAPISGYAHHDSVDNDHQSDGRVSSSLRLVENAELYSVATSTPGSGS